MRKFLLFVSFVLGNFSILLIAILFLTIRSSRSIAAQDAAPIENLILPAQVYNYSVKPPFPAPLQATIITDDARVKIIDQFLTRYVSPMTGLGRDLVSAADRHQIPYTYLPAIAQCEGLLGKAIPAGSYNSWGWGIYGDKITRFSSWQEAIETVARGLRRDYFDFGLDTPEKIMPKYTPPSKGSWAFCVNKFLLELQ